MSTVLSKDIVNELHGGQLATKRTAENIEAAKKKVNDLKEKLNKVTAISPESEAPNNPGDWTKIYSACERYEDPQELQSAVDEETNKLKHLTENAMLSAHQHDHHEEREMFERPEEEKLAMCESHRELGNMLFAEGLEYLPKAAEQYQVALSYYEYCFPETPEAQEHLENLKYACHCNISLCYYRMGYLREAVNAATLAIRSRDVEAGAKAYFRRAQAYRALDEYSRAAADIKMAASLAPHDAGIAEEVALLQNQIERWNKKEKALAEMWISPKDEESRSHQYHGHTAEDSNIYSDIFTAVGDGVDTVVEDPVIECKQFSSKQSEETEQVDFNREMSNMFSLTLPLEPVLDHAC